MVKGIYHSAAGMLARQRHLEVVANNLANAATVGFKKENVRFQSALNSSLVPSRPLTRGEPFVEVVGEIQRSDQQGPLSETGNPLDLAIIGEGYFAVETSTGVAYTRDGRFHLNAEGELVTLSGYRVLTLGGTVSLPRGDLEISADGSLLLRNHDGQSPEVLDRLQVVTFADPSRLQHANHGLLVTQQEPLEISPVRLQVGYLEDSNVNIIAEMVKMIEINRYYEASARAIQTQDGTLGKAVNEVGKT